MKIIKNKNLKNVILMFMFAALFSLLTSNVKAATVSSIPNGVTFEPGNSIFIDVVAQSFPETQGGGFNLVYDPTVISAISVSIDNMLWNFITDTGTIDNGAGTISDVLLSTINAVGSGPAGDFVVATLEFLAIGEGSSLLTLSESSLNPWASYGNNIDPLFQTSSITVSAIPIPASLYLFISGLSLLIAPRAGKLAARTLREA